MPEQHPNEHPDPHPEPDEPGRGAGQPVTTPQTAREPSGEPHTPKDASIKQSLPLPRDLDESVNMTGQGDKDDPDKLDPSVQQAARDLEAGLKDTSRAPEADRSYKKMSGKPDE